MSRFTVQGQRVVVVGGSRSGIAASRLLAARGARVILTDLKASLPEQASLAAAGIGLELGGHHEATLAQADLVVVSPGVPPDQPAVRAARAAGVPVVGEVELASRWLRGRIIAVTGTKGKSTTTTLIGRMLAAGGVRAIVGGNIGEPLASQVDGADAATVHVVEVSSFQLETIVSFRPWIALVLNFSPDHLDRHASVGEYATAKARIFENQTPDDWAVVNADDAPAIALARDARSRRRWFAMDTPIERGVAISGGHIVARTAGGERPLVAVSEVRLVGRHLLGDVVAAAAVADLAGTAPEAMAAAVRGFRGLEHALEIVGEVAGVRFVNDSKATNIASARRSIESFEGSVVPIMGGRYKGGDFRDLREVVAGRVSAVVAIGESRPLIRGALADLVPVLEAGSMADAVGLAHEAAGAGGTVVLAPACSSFDMFNDYAERGRVFKEEVGRLAATRQAGGR